MKIYQFKTILFDYFNEKICQKFPQLEGKIYRENLLLRQPSYPFVTMHQPKRSRLDKRFDAYCFDDKFYIKCKYQTTVLFSVHSLCSDKNLAEKFSDELIDFIEELFLLNPTTHIDLNQKEIVINELLSSDVTDESKVINSNHEFVKSVSIVFEYEDVKEISSELGADLQINIEVKS